MSNSELLLVPKKLNWTVYLAALEKAIVVTWQSESIKLQQRTLVNQNWWKGKLLSNHIPITIRILPHHQQELKIAPSEVNLHCVVEHTAQTITRNLCDRSIYGHPVNKTLHVTNFVILLSHYIYSANSHNSLQWASFKKLPDQ